MSEQKKIFLTFELLDIQIAKSRMDKLDFILEIKEDQTIIISDKTIEKIKTYLPHNVYNNIFEDYQLLVIAMILINTTYNENKDKEKKAKYIKELENLLFDKGYKSTWDYHIDQNFYSSKTYYKNAMEFSLIKKILIKDLKIDKILFEQITQSKLLEGVSTAAILSDNYYIVKMLLLCKELSIKDNLYYYNIFKDIIKPDHKTESLESKTGGKKKTKYNIFLSKELKRLKKINPNKDYKLRFKEAVNNWKNKK
tara:strand:+ start:1463 stop:2221 length:759 start_codon:yes stop_codon:yes gene_type:complete